MNVQNLIAARKVVSECELTQNEAVVLVAVGVDKVIVGSVSAITGMLSAAVSRTLNSLEERGLIKRAIGEDRRNIVVTLTNEGILVYDRLQKELERI